MLRHHEPHLSYPLQNPSSQLPGNMTQMPDSVISSSPAWDPSSQMPIVEPELGKQLVVQPSHVTHPLLDP